MAVQSSTQITRQQAQALYDMQGALENADKRVEEATQDTFNAMQEALEQTQANNRTLAERNAQLSGENGTLKTQLKEMSENSTAQKKAQESSSEAEKKRINNITNNIETESQEIIEFALDLIKKTNEFRNLRRASGCLDSMDEQIDSQADDKFITNMNRFIELAKKIQDQTNRLS